MPRFGSIQNLHAPMLLALILITATWAGVGETRPYRIGRVTIVRKPILDKDNFSGHQIIPRMVNKLHIMTKWQVIRNELLFKEGDVYDPELVEETERNLRKLDIIGEVSIHRDTLDDQTIDLTVYARDTWSLEFGGSYKQEGGIIATRATLKDNNFLGNGQSIRASYNWRSDRDIPRGVAFSLYEKRLLGSWWTARVQYRQAEELALQSIGLSRSFYREASTWAGGVYVDRRTVRPYYYDNVPLTRSFLLRQYHQQAWSSLSLGHYKKLRIGAAFYRVRSRTKDLPLRPIYNLDLISLSLSPRYLKYYQVTRVNNFGRIEDIPIGYLFNVMMAKNFYHAAPNTPDYYFRVDVKVAARVNRKFYWGYRASASSFLIGNEFRDATTDFEVLQHYRLTSFQTLATRLRGIFGTNWSPYRQLTLGAPTGLRGYPAYALRGQRLVLLNIENRVFTPLKLWMFRFGGVIFFDAGQVWQESESPDLQQLRTSYGFGLRIENTMLPGYGITRIDFAFTPQSNGLAEVIISSDQLFRGFLGMGFIAPSAIR
ncbi:MAG: BamA/TamA family outer membrane protein [Candidatus Marinimicrobia bacterium]|nr:BamA/TamA family outer membrane protein [Candidatus Neomarinimicrobiota bacterium]